MFASFYNFQRNSDDNRFQMNGKNPASNQMSLKLDHFHSFFPLSSFPLPFLYNHHSVLTHLLLLFSNTIDMILTFLWIASPRGFYTKNFFLRENNRIDPALLFDTISLIVLPKAHCSRK